MISRLPQFSSELREVMCSIGHGVKRILLKAFWKPVGLPPVTLPMDITFVSSFFDKGQ